MQVINDKVVSFHYSLKLADDTPLENSENSDPLVYLHGKANIVPGLEKGLEGKSIGDGFSVTVNPAEGYGEYNPQLQMRMPIKNLQTKGKLKANTLAIVQTDDGPRQVRVTKVGRFHADVDANHPLAGQTLVFDGKIEDIRDATEEELMHGHAHGPGGHQH